MSTDTSTYTVTGMSCGSCANKVSTVVGELAGVTDVQVDITTSELRVTGEQPVDEALVREAVEGAGYELRSS